MKTVISSASLSVFSALSGMPANMALRVFRRDPRTNRYFSSSYVVDSPIRMMRTLVFVARLLERDQFEQRGTLG